MKKTILLIITIIVVYFAIGNLFVSKKLIPDEAIRLRVLANSNSTYDQEVKEKVRDQIQSSMYNLLKDTKGIGDARTKIVHNIPSIQKDIDQVLTKEKYNLGYTVDFGTHYFPEKTYKGLTYDEGNYESLLITLGKGEGNNWWCVLFPPLCLLEAEESEEVEYQFFIKELIDKYL